MGAIDARGSFRLRQLIDFNWSVPEQGMEGTGKIYNLSMSGIMFQTNKFFKPDHRMIILLSSAMVPALPSKGKLMWFSRRPKAGGYLCGVEFVKTLAISSPWYKWMEANIMKLAEASDAKIVGQYLKSGSEE